MTSTYKAGDSSDIINYRSISILPYFFKILERLMYSRLYKYFKENIILYEKQFNFQSRRSTNDAIFQFSLRVFIDLPKTFNTVGYSILPKILRLYGITNKILYGLKVTYLIEIITFKYVGIVKQILNMFLVTSPKDLFLDNFCF